jgi:hypothetical protein
MRDSLFFRVPFSILILFLFVPATSFSDSNIPWQSRHFPDAPRISAEQALVLRTSNVKMAVIDAPYSSEGYNESHICGAIQTNFSAEALDRLIKKIPKNYLIISYCK